MNDPDATLELHTRAVNALGDVYATISFFEGTRATEPNQRLDVDENGTPTTAPVPEHAVRCVCGAAVPLIAEFNECACGRVVSANDGDRDPVDAAMRADTSRAARKRIRRHLDAIASHVEALVAEETKWTKPSGKRLDQLRKLAEGEVEQDSRDWSDWCRVHRKAGERVPVSTNEVYARDQLCWKCGPLYAAFLRERPIQSPKHAMDTLERLVLDGHGASPTAEQVTEAAGVTADAINAKSSALSKRPPVPKSARRKNGAWHSIDDYAYRAETG